MIGTYILFLESAKDMEIDVGGLGRFHFSKGIYAYIGSAMGRAVNLENRIKRHRKLAKEKKGNRKWHIDYFTTAPGVELTGIIRITGKGIECRIAGLMKKGGGKLVAQGFGSSDCKCKTHFFMVSEKISRTFLRSLPEALD